jgi:hypothetical protein
MTLTAPVQPVYALAFGAHPDDVELACGATLLKIMDEGQRVAVCDLTAGVMGTLGTAETRRQESALATERMGYTAREQLDLGDSELFYTKENLHEVIRVIRKYRPDTVSTGLFCKGARECAGNLGKEETAPAETALAISRISATTALPVGILPAPSPYINTLPTASPMR